METPEKQLDFTQPPVEKAVVTKEGLEPSSVAALYSFSLDDVLQELKEIREEVEETCAIADDVKVVPESAYDETLSLLKKMLHNTPMPDIMWLEDGGIGLEWRPGSGIATMSLYGDDLVIYGAFFNNKREISGICALSDPAFLPGFLTTLSRLFQRKDMI